MQFADFFVSSQSETTPKRTMNIGKPIKTLCFIAVLLLAIVSRATTIGEERMAHLSMSDGLTGETVYRIMTDHWGITGIATNSGVSFYTGTKLYNYRIVDELGRNQSVCDLCETTADGTIYAAAENGLYRMPKDSNDFVHVLPEIEHPLCLMGTGSTLYIGSEQGIHIYDGKRLKHIDVDVSRHGLDNIVRQYDVCEFATPHSQREKGKIWFLGRFDLNSYDPKTDKITRHKLALPVGNHILSQFACLGNGRFAIGTRGNGLYLYDINTDQAKHVEGIGNLVTSVRRSSDGSICVATDGAGTYRLEMRNEKGEMRNELVVKEHFSTEGDVDHCLPSNATTCYYRDKNGVNWFGFVRYGLAYTYYSGSLFKVFKAGDFTTEGINVRTSCRHGDDVVIGTQNGFYYVNTKTGQYRYYSPDDLGGGHIVNTICWYDGRFYIGTFDGGLRQFDPQTMALTRQSYTPLLDDTSIGDLKAGPDGRLWVGCGRGLIIIAGGQVEQYFTEQNSRIVGGLILSITFDQNGNAWLTGEKGCSLYSVRSHGIVETTFPKGFFNAQPWMRGALGHDGLVFMRTGPQTFYTNEQMTDFGELKFPVTFADKWCRSIVDDMKGHYFLSSERGVLRIDYALKDIILLGYGEGLRGEFINDMAVDDDNHLLVATSQGLFSCPLDKLEAWRKTSLYKIILSNIRKGSDLLPGSEDCEVNDTHEIRLHWNMTSEVLQVQPIIPDYSKQKGRLFEYRIGGNEWCLIDFGQPIRLSNLLLGEHRLEIRQAGRAGTSSVFTIIVVPTIWAIIEFVLAIAAIVFLWWWWNWRKTTKILLSEREEIEDALVEMDHELNELNELKMVEEELGEVSKYQKVKIDEEECAAIVKRMKEYLDRERVYTNADLKMKDLADVLHLSAPKLSQVFNLYLGQNYYDFINGYRLAEFKRLIDEGEYKRYTITALSEQCGFKKSNFFSTFRKVEGMSPQEYLKKIGVKLG